MTSDELSVHAHTPGLTAFDPRGLTVRTVGYWRDGSQPAQPRINRMSHDSAGRMVAQRDPRLWHTAQANLVTAYSLSARVIGTNSVDAGWRVSLSGEGEQLLEQWDGRGTRRQIRYDDQLRPVEIIENEASIEQLAYGNEASSKHNQCGRLIRHDDPAGILLFNDYSMAGAVLEEERRFSGEPVPGYVTRSRLTPLGDLQSRTDAGANVQRFSHTLEGRLRAVDLCLSGTAQWLPMVSAIRYNAQGQIEEEVAGNGVVTTLEYDVEDGRLSRLFSRLGQQAPVQDLQYAYDPLGNVLSIEDAALPIRYFANQRIEPISRYRYDSQSQLTEATGWESGSIRHAPSSERLKTLSNYRQTYRFDAGNNLLEMTHVGVENPGHRLVADAGSNRCLSVREGVEPGEADFRKGFDANGNLRCLQPGCLLSWDLRNQLSEVRPVERVEGPADSECYVYGADGRRVRKIRSLQTRAQTNLIETRYLPGLEIRTHSGTREVLHVIDVQTGRASVRVLHWEAGRPQDIANNQQRYSLSDHLGSSTLELDQDASVITRECYYPFGGTAWTDGDAVQVSYKTIRYSGKERDATGFYYYGLRYYLPEWQRWLNPDPAGAADGLNLYGMVRNRPMSLTDGDGRQSNFKDLFKPEQGDLIFGLAKVLEKGYLGWWAVLSNRGDYLAKYLNGDDIAELENDLDVRRQSYSSIRDASRFMNPVLPAGNTGSRPTFWEGQYSSIAQLVFMREEAYYQKIRNRYSGWKSTAANRRFSERYATELAGGRYSVRKTFEKYLDADDKFPHKLISRASKAGLATLLNSESTDVIHFMLDELDMDQVVMKTRPSATSSELRYLFRNREKLADKVLFYRNNTLVDAPWRSDRAGWERYRPAREEQAVKTAQSSG